MSGGVPQGKLARSGVAGLAAMKVGARTLQHKVKRPFLSEAKQQEAQQSVHDKNAEVLFKALVQLRGTALKVAQMIGMEQGLLPDSYRKELEKSFHQVPPLNRVLVRKAITDALHQPPEKVFTEFDTKAFAAASLGQVHKGKIAEQDVAVKVQYPSIHVAIKNDLGLIRGVARGMSNTHLILQSLDEIEARLLEEVDYRNEAENTRWFKERVTMEGIYIPAVYDEFSSERVLTTEFIEGGLHLDAWLKTNPSQDMRNKVGQRLFDFFGYATHELQCLHADPNPGNYLFHEDGSITIIDFGCVRHVSDQFVEAYPRLVKAYIDDDPVSLFPAYEEIGMNYEQPDEIYQEVLRGFGQWISQPFLTESFDFAANADYTRRGKEPMKKMHDSIKVDRIAEEFIFHNRTYYGLLQIFEKIGANVRMCEHLN